MTSKTTSRSSAIAALAWALAAGAPAAAQTPTPSLDPCAAATPLATTPGTPHTVSVVAPRVTLRLAIAATEPQRERGLMCITALAHGTGMIFVFPGSDDVDRNFWMKDTLLPLDMVFVDHAGRVTSVAANVPSTTPDTPDAEIPTRHGRARYVIELGAGEAARDGIAAGTRLRIGTLHGS